MSHDIIDDRKQKLVDNINQILHSSEAAHFNDNHATLTEWFNQLWDETEDFDETLMHSLKQSWAMMPVRPYDIYMKTLYMLVRDRLTEESASEIMIDLNFPFDKTP